MFGDIFENGVLSRMFGECLGRDETWVIGVGMRGPHIVNSRERLVNLLWVGVCENVGGNVSPVMKIR